MPRSLRLPPLPTLARIGLILFSSRVCAEIGARIAWPAGAVAGGLVGLTSGYALTRIGVRKGLDDARTLRVRPHRSYQAPTIIAWIYVLYPTYDLRVAGLVGVAGIVWTLIEQFPRPDRRLADAAVFVVALALYWLTLARGLLPADAGEFQLAAATLGVAHPPGYPLYTLLGWVFTRLMPANPMRGLNLFSAVTMALAVVIVGRAARRFSDGARRRGMIYHAPTGGDVWAGIVAAALFAVAASVWSTGTQASIRPLTALFMALCIERLAAYRQAVVSHFPSYSASHLPSPASGGGGRSPEGVKWDGKAERKRERILAGFMLAFGLGVAHHPSLAFAGIVFAAYLLLIDPGIVRQPRRWPRLIGALALGFVPWLYLPVRGAMGAALAPPDLATWPGFWNHVLARGFAGDFFYFRTLPELGDRFLIWLNILSLQWHPAILVAGLLAALTVAWRDWRTLALLGGVFGLHSLVTMTYRAPQTVEYLIPAYVALAILIGAGLSKAGFLKAPAADKIPAALTIAASMIQMIGQWPSFAWLAQDNSTRETADALLAEAPPDAAILASWHWATPLEYLQEIDGARPDVEATYVYPQGAEPLALTWVRQIEDTISERPVMITSFYPAEFGGTPYFFEPVDGGWRVRTSPRRDLPEGMTPLEGRFDTGLTLVGYELVSQPAVGDTFEVRAAWRIDAPQSQDITASISFNNPNIAIHNSDVLLPTGRAGGGDILVDRHILGMPPYGLPSPQDQYYLMASAYEIGPDGRPRNLSSGGRFYFTTLREVTVAPPEWPTLWRADSGQAALGGEMILTRVEVSHPGPLHPGDEVMIDLTFLSERPLLRDYVVKVDLIGEGYAWRAQSDHIPATGALPTLKWLFGWEVRDRHRLIVPPDASTSAAHAELVVYDHFTGQALPILDVELARQGIAVPLYRWEP